MKYFLNIHATTSIAVIALCIDDKVVASRINPDPKQHASFLHEAILQLLSDNQITVQDLSAVGVTNGPGSYTGIRVGLAAAKGLCYALNIPLITFNALQSLALTLINTQPDVQANYFAMIDARRMEVFIAGYNEKLEEVFAPQAMVLDEDVLDDFKDRKIYFFGDGSAKFKDMWQGSNTIFVENIEISPEAMAQICFLKYRSKNFENIAYAEPLYLKEFYSNIKK